MLAEYDVVITTYATLTKEYPKVLANRSEAAELKKQKLPIPRQQPGPLYRCTWHRAVVDEAHNIKNRKTGGFAAACCLPAKIRWALTGTPLQNSVDDVWSLFVFIRYRFLPKMSFAKWTETWKQKLENTRPSIRNKAFKRFQPVVAVVTLRRTKLDTIDGCELIALPPRLTEVKEADFRLPSEAVKYQKLKDNSHAEINRLRSLSGGLQMNYTGIMVLLLRLRQACCHPFLAEFAASKQRGWNGTGDGSFVSQYSVEQLDEAQLLVESGVTGLERLREGLKDALLRTLAPPKDGELLPAAESDDCVGCVKCGQQECAVRHEYTCRRAYFVRLVLTARGRTRRWASRRTMTPSWSWMTCARRCTLMLVQRVLRLVKAGVWRKRGCAARKGMRMWTGGCGSRRRRFA